MNHTFPPLDSVRIQNAGKSRSLLRGGVIEETGVTDRTPMIQESADHQYHQVKFGKMTKGNIRLWTRK